MDPKLPPTQQPVQTPVIPPSVAVPREPLVPQKPTSSRKFIVIGVIVMALLLLIIIVLALKPKKPTITPSEGSVVRTVTPTSVNWKSYKTPYYTVSYPGDWKVSVVSDSNGQQVTLFGPQIDMGTKVPSVLVDARTATSEASMQTSIDSLTHVLGFQASPETDGGKFSTVYAGSFPVSQIQGVTRTEVHQERDAYLYTNGIAYQISFSYPGDKTDQMYEALFMKLLQGITLQ